MDVATMRDRRGIAWSRAVAARAAAWRLEVDKPSLLGTGEAMATLVADPHSEVWGVLYEISAHDYEHLELTEGVAIGHYRRTRVLVEPDGPWVGSPDGRVEAWTLVSEERDPTIRPTTRYMALLVSGAIDHDLPAWWIERLRRVDAKPESAEVAALRPFFDRAMRRPD